MIRKQLAIVYNKCITSESAILKLNIVQSFCHKITLFLIKS
ncbi:hypothetical protein A1OE_990 [Candidatus Endolissoclinum faulkneri L2]|uniref:Uncharacterized protein n=1 Tax=Candidatus Endolissoclinum faulkneri L2 TaxID=1193729 RepID=K7ZD43_9PROT|nr:hypothetical protein A1OE_990 [Candidatus Endolissoclinum faulkneri L2]